MNKLSQKSMFTRVIRKSLRNRWGKVWVAILAVAVGATLASSFLAISMSVEGMVERELRSYGANILVTPKAAMLQVGSGELGFGTVAEKKFLNDENLNEIRNGIPKENLLGYYPILYVPVNTISYTVVFAGTWPDEIRHINPWWRVEGNWVDDRDSLTEAMMGRALAENIGVQVGETLTISHNDHVENVKIVGIVSTGGPEENQIIGTLRLAQRFTKQPDAIHMVWVSVLAQGKDLEKTAKIMEERMGNADVKTLRQIAQAEELVLTKLSFVMILVTSLVLAASGLGVMSTMTTSVMERRCETGLMKALGAEDRRISLFHFAEASLIGFIGGAIGFIVGSGFAALIGFQVFGKAISPQPLVFFITLLISLGVVLLASIIPVKNTLRIEAATTLRGE